MVLDFGTDSVLRIADGIFKYYAPGGATPELYNTGSGTVPAESWSFLSISRTSGITRMFLNGVMQVKNSTGGGYWNAQAVRIGARGSTNANKYKGELSDLRIIKGTSLYQSDSSFTPPTEPLTAVTNTKLFIQGQGAKVFDKSQSSNLALIGNTTGHATTKFSGAFSTYFDGSGDYLVVPASSEINFGTSDFTVEFWINFAAFPSNGYILNKEDSSGNDFTLQYYQNAIKVSNATVGSGWSHYSSGIGSLSTGTWYHIAYCRSSGTLKSYKDGTEVNSATDSRNYNLNNAITLGSRYPGDYAANVYIQDLRITKGLAHYTANFTPPTAPLKG